MVSSLGRAMPMLSGPVFGALFSVLDFNQFSQYGRSSTKKAHTLWITRSERAKTCTAHRLISGYFECWVATEMNNASAYRGTRAWGVVFLFVFSVFTCPNWPNYMQRALQNDVMTWFVLCTDIQQVAQTTRQHDHQILICVEKGRCLSRCRDHNEDSKHV